MKIDTIKTQYKEMKDHEIIEWCLYFYNLFFKTDLFNDCFSSGAPPELPNTSEVIEMINSGEYVLLKNK